MTDETENNEEQVKRKKRGETESEGAVGARSNIAFSVNATQLKEIMANWRHLDLGETISAVVEFFSDGITRASANLSVDWVKAASLKNAGYALMNKFDAFGKDMMRAMRERTREATAYVQRKYGVNYKIKRGGQTIVTSNPNPGG